MTRSRWERVLIGCESPCLTDRCEQVEGLHARARLIVAICIVYLSRPIVYNYETFYTGEFSKLWRLSQLIVYCKILYNYDFHDFAISSPSPQTPTTGATFTTFTTFQFPLLAPKLPRLGRLSRLSRLSRLFNFLS